MKMKWTLALGAALAVTAAGCMTYMPDPRKHSFDPVKLSSYAGVPDAMGKLVLFSGTAYNSRTGPVVVGDGLAVHCQGMNEWPDRLLGKKVTVSGLLDHAREGEEESAASGAVGGSGQGLASVDYVLKHPKLE